MAKTTVVEEPVYSAGRREDIEAELTELGLTWRFNADGSLADIDMNKSLANQARLGEPINRERIETYKEALRAHAKFPALVVDFTGRKRKGVLMDGNHRAIASQEAEFDIFARYEVTDGDPSAITLYTFRANVKHGLPNSIEDRIEHAIWLIESGVTQAQALRQLQIPATQFKKAWSYHQADKRADEAGVDRTLWDALAGSVRQRLLNVSTDDALVAAAKLTHRAGLTTDEVFDLVSQLNATKSWARQQQILKAMEQVYADRIKSGAGGKLRGAERRALTPKQRWNMALGFIAALPEPQAVVRQIAGAERDDYKKRLTDAGQKMIDLAKSL